MKKLMLASLLLLSCRCATTPVNPYAYSGVMSEAECAAECGSRAMPSLGIKDGECKCDETKCGRSRNHGGCDTTPVK